MFERDCYLPVNFFCFILLKQSHLSFFSKTQLKVVNGFNPKSLVQSYRHRSSLITKVNATLLWCTYFLVFYFWIFFCRKVYENLKNIWRTSPFIGLTKSKIDDTWYWIDGVKAWKNSSFWAENRPRSYANYTCAVLHRNLTGNITDRNCTKNNVPGLCAFDILHFPIKTDLWKDSIFFIAKNIKK